MNKVKYKTTLSVCIDIEDRELWEQIARHEGIKKSELFSKLLNSYIEFTGMQININGVNYGNKN